MTVQGVGQIRVPKWAIPACQTHARIANDSNTMAQQEKITAKLEQELKQVRVSENEQIRRVLTPEQRNQFEAVIQQRRASVGSSRDARHF
jgi:Spy/CpxP family protein refolding chaperone